MPQDDPFSTPGWARDERRGMLPDFGPVWMRGDPGDVIFAFRAAPHHATTDGTVSTAALLAFADHYVGSAAVPMTGASMVTLQLETSFLGTARVGDIITGQAQIVGLDGKLIHLAGTARAGGRVISRSAGIWKILPVL